jgi:predicted TIM-barrel fold metal-dependent hydrolase
MQTMGERLNISRQIREELGLPDAILRKIYHDNAARLLGMKALSV